MDDIQDTKIKATGRRITQARGRQPKMLGATFGFVEQIIILTEPQ